MVVEVSNSEFLFGQVVAAATACPLHSHASFAATNCKRQESQGQRKRLPLLSSQPKWLMRKENVRMEYCKAKPPLVSKCTGSKSEGDFSPSHVLMRQLKCCEDLQSTRNPNHSALCQREGAVSLCSVLRALGSHVNNHVGSDFHGSHDNAHNGKIQTPPRSGRALKKDTILRRLSALRAAMKPEVVLHSTYAQAHFSNCRKACFFVWGELLVLKSQRQQ